MAGKKKKTAKKLRIPLKFYDAVGDLVRMVPPNRSHKPRPK
jgi:hypothetical protein